MNIHIVKRMALCFLLLIIPLLCSCGNRPEDSVEQTGDGTHIEVTTPTDRSVQTAAVSLSDLLPSVLSCGERLELSTLFEDEGFSSLDWSSSDSTVISIDKGVLTAISPGSAEISMGQVDIVTISVLDDLESSTMEVLERLAEMPTAEAVADFERQRERLERSSGERAQQLRSKVESFAAASESGMNTEEAAAALGIDKESSFRAAEGLRMGRQLSDHGVTLSFTGDCTMGYLNEDTRASCFQARYKASGSSSFPFDGVKHVFAADDLTVINFEGTLAEKNTPMADKKYHFRGESEYVGLLSNSSIEVANLANNHSMDYGEEGFMRTQTLLEEGGVGVVHAQHPYVTEINGIETVLLSAGHRKQPSYIDEAVSEMLEQIEQYKRPGNLVIVNLHWGGEYTYKPDDAQIEAAHTLIDAGADMIVCHHAHIAQGIELYGGRVIAYGLGNFSFSGTGILREKQSFILRAAFEENDGGEVKMKEWGVVPCYSTSTGSNSNDFQPKTLHGEDADKVMEHIRSRCRLIDGCQEIPRS